LATEEPHVEIDRVAIAVAALSELADPVKFLEAVTQAIAKRQDRHQIILDLQNRTKARFEKTASAKFSEAQIADMLRLKQAGTPLSKIARQYGVRYMREMEALLTAEGETQTEEQS
jgi:hypothetical protein